jgi:FixJ family two-component response regulator
MNKSPFTIYLVDDDPGVLQALTRMLSAKGYDVQAFSSSTDFLDRHDRSVPGCAILDVSMPDLDGLELQKAMKARGVERPVIFLTGVGDIPMTVQAMRNGAIDFLTKPIRSSQLLAAVALASDREAEVLARHSELTSINHRLSRLTPREREVLTHVIAGRLNKQIAVDLGTVEQTIKMHRSRMMHKIGVRTVADLVRITELAGVRPSYRRD